VRGAGIGQLAGFGVAGQEGPVGGDIVSEELTEDHIPGRDARVFERLVNNREGGVHARGRPPEPDRALQVNLAGEEPGKHPAVFPTEGGSGVLELRVY
jgi:hypothetical protein